MTGIPAPARLVVAAGAALACLLVATTCAFAQSTSRQVRRTTLAEHTTLFSAPEGNMVMYNGPASVLVAGVQSPALVRAALREMGPRRNRQLYVIALAAEGAAGWG
ncbi:MAG: hypothetical protein ACSLFK_14725, partial [Gemmatimonadaceae bacterium]